MNSEIVLDTTPAKKGGQTQLKEKGNENKASKLTKTN